MQIPNFASALAELYRLEGMKADTSQEYRGIERPKWEWWFREQWDGFAWPPTDQQADEFYRIAFWQEIGCDELPDPLARQYFLFAVNAGHAQAQRELQRAISVATRRRLKVDGEVGPVTREALLYADGRAVLVAFLAQCEGFYRILEAKKVWTTETAEAVIRRRLYGES